MFNENSIFKTLVIIFFIIIITQTAQAGVILPAEYLRKSGEIVCGYTGKQWEPGKYTYQRFTPFSFTVGKWQIELQSATGARRSELIELINTLQAKIATQNEQFCSTLSKPVKIKSLTQIPKAHKLAVATGVASLYTPAEVSGTPPTLPQITDTGAENLFWLPGLVSKIKNGTANAGECRQFWVGFNDGESGGLGACVMAQTIGQIFQPVMKAAQDLCWFQKAPTVRNLEAGGIEVISGELPNNDITQIFNPPSGTNPRIVRVIFHNPVNGDTAINVRIYSLEDNRQNGNQYRAEIFVCYTQGETADYYQKMVIKTNGKYRAESADTEGEETGGYKTIFNASLIANENGGAIFDSSKERVVISAYEHPLGAIAFRSLVNITPTDYMIAKSYQAFDNYTNYRYDRTVSSFIGNTIFNVKFLEGSYKAEDHNGSNPVYQTLGATEYRDTYYASAPNNPLVDWVSATDFETDPFYSTELGVTIDTTAFPCDIEPEIIVRIDLSNQTLVSSLMECINLGFEEMIFCNSEEINQARANWFNFCPELIAQ